MDRLDTDVVVVGAGGAGVTAAVAAQRAGAGVLLLAVEPIGSGDTRISEGRMAYPARLPGDSAEGFAQEVLAAGAGLSRADLVWTLAVEGWEALHTYERFGLLFRRDESGVLGPGAAVRRGGHSMARTFEVSGTGIAVGAGLKSWAAREGVRALDGVLVSEIILGAGRVAGVAGLRLADGEAVVVSCRSVVLATGSAGWLYYPHTDCVRANTGGGYALALAAGARLVDIEQVQFIPFGVAYPRSSLGLFLGEGTLAGPHGTLLDRDGRVLLTGLPRMTRAEVVRVMAAAMHEGRGGPHGGTFLDLRPNLAHPEGERLLQTLRRNGTLATVRRAYGRDAAALQVPWEVLPTAHYNMGGVLVDSDGRTGVPGLYAAGAVSGGLHGGNRLGSLGLAESVVFGRRAGRAAARTAGGAGAGPLAAAAARDAEERLLGLYGRRGGTRPIELVRRLQGTMWELCGPGRTEAGLDRAIEELDGLERQSPHASTGAARAYNAEVRELLDLRSMLAAARAIVLAARARRESRGAHLRLDHPGTDEVALHTMVSAVPGSAPPALEVGLEPVPGPSPAVRER